MPIDSGKMMAGDDSRELKPNVRLHAFQEKVVRKFLERGSARFVQLNVPAGCGKTLIACRIVKELSDTPELNRVLVATPKALVDQWRYRLEEFDTGLEVNVVTRDRYLDLREASVSTGTSLWPARSIFVVGQDVVDRSAVHASLTNEKWDLVILDGIRQSAASESDLYTDFLRNKAQKILALGPPTEAALPDAKRVEIKFEDVIDELRIPTQSPTTYIEFESSPDECELIEEVNQFLQSMASSGMTHLAAQPVAHAGLSSTYALERELIQQKMEWQTLRNRLAHHREVNPELVRVLTGDRSELRESARKVLWKEHDKAAYLFRLRQRGENPRDIAEKLGLTVEAIDRYIKLHEWAEKLYVEKSARFLELFAHIETLLEMISDLRTDTKGEAFFRYINESVSENPRYDICVVTSYENTAKYLNILLEEIHLQTHLVVRSSMPEENEKVLAEYSDNGGILIITTNALMGRELVANLCINYDESLTLQREQLIMTRTRAASGFVEMVSFKNRSEVSIHL